MTQKPRSILLVDDSETHLLLLESLLNNKGWDIHRAKSASAGMEKVRTIKPDLILLDLQMPQIDGYEMLDWLQAKEQYRGIPVIVISGVNENNTYDICIKKGAIDYMPKPVDSITLLKKIKKILTSPTRILPGKEKW